MKMSGYASTLGPCARGVRQCVGVIVPCVRDGPWRTLTLRNSSHVLWEVGPSGVGTEEP